MDNIVLYSTGCPKCTVLKTKLKQKNIDYIECSDIDTMTEKGFKSVPKLELSDGSILDFTEAVKWIGEQ